MSLTILATPRTTRCPVTPRAPKCSRKRSSIQAALIQREPLSARFSENFLTDMDQFIQPKADSTINVSETIVDSKLTGSSLNFRCNKEQQSTKLTKTITPKKSLIDQKNFPTTPKIEFGRQTKLGWTGVQTPKDNFIVFEDIQPMETIDMLADDEPMDVTSNHLLYTHDSMEVDDNMCMEVDEIIDEATVSIARNQ
uniref:Uncharacterized protein n=1 Tax=Caenorhabditis japonica TaxID=281687 RepID=A0A8R1HMN9_CAEJA